MKHLALIPAFLIAFVGLAYAASINLSISITSPPATAITFTPVAPFTGSGTTFSAVGQVASGTTVGTFSITPTTWNGGLSLSGSQAALFSLSGMNLVTAGPLNAGTNNSVIVTAIP